MYILSWSDSGQDQDRAILAGAAEGGAPGQRSVGPGRGQRSGATGAFVQISQVRVFSTRLSKGMGMQDKINLTEPHSKISDIYFVCCLLAGLLDDSLAFL